MASTRKKPGKSGRTIWQSVWREPGKNGQARQRTKNHASARSREHASKMEQEVERRGVGDPDRQTTAKFLHGWLNLLEQRGEHSPSTLDGYRRNIGLAERESATSRSPNSRRPILIAPMRPCSPAAARCQPDQSPRRTQAAAAQGPNGAARPSRAAHRARTGPQMETDSRKPRQGRHRASPAKAPARAFTAAEVQRLLAAAAGDRIMTTVVSLLLVTGIRR